MTEKTVMDVPIVTQLHEDDVVYTVVGGTSDGRFSIGQLKEYLTISGVPGSEVTIIRSPTPVSPITGDIDVSVTTTLEAGIYATLYGVARQYREFQVDIASGDFSNPIRVAQINSDSWIVTPALPDATDFKWRCRDVDLNGDTGRWSDVQTFSTTNQYIVQPTITSLVNGDTLNDRGTPILASEFQTVNLSDVHVASFWEFYRDGILIHESGRTEIDLTSYQPPQRVIIDSEVHEVRVRYEGSEGNLSDWSIPVKFTGFGVGYGKYLSIAHANPPYTTMLGIDETSFANLETPVGGLPTGNGNAVAFSTDGAFKAVGHTAYPYLTIYRRRGDSLTNIQLPLGSLPSGHVYGLAFNSAGDHLAVAQGSAPFIAIYKRDGDTFTRLPQLTAVPPTESRSVSFSPDGSYLAVGHYATPFITIYKRSGDSYTKLSNPTVLPTSTARGVAFTSDGTHLLVATEASVNTQRLRVYRRDGDVFTNVNDIATVPTGNGYGVSVSSNGVYTAVAHATTPFITIYKRDNGVLNKLNNPATLPTGQGNGVSFSTDMTYLAVAHATTPFITIYKRSGDTFTKLANPAALPASTGECVAFSADGVYLAVGHQSTPFITIYKRSGDTFTKLANPASLPTSAVTDVSFSSNGVYLSLSLGRGPFIYKRSGDTFTKLTTPDITYTTNAGVSFSPTVDRFVSSTSSHVSVYSRSGDTFTRVDHINIPTGTAFKLAISPDGEYLVAGATSGIGSGFKLSLLKRDGPTYTLLPSENWVFSSIGSISFAPNGRDLAVAHSAPPSLTTFTIENDRLIQTSILGELPSSACRGIAVGGNTVVVANDATPYVVIYEWNGRALTHVRRPSTTPVTGPGNGAAVSPDGSLATVVHDVAPFVTSFSVKNLLATKLNEPGTLPSGSGLGAAYYIPPSSE